MSELDTNFNKAAENAKNLVTRPSDQQLLELYGLFKQGSVGDNDKPKPGMFELKEKAKHEAWLKRKGMSQEEAKKAYIKLIDELIQSYGLK